MNVLDADFKSKLKLLLIKDEQLDEQINQTVSRIIKEVYKSGDKALLQMVTKLDGIIPMAARVACWDGKK